MEAAGNRVLLTDDDLVMRNLKSSAYRLILRPIAGEVIDLASNGNLVFTSVLHQGVHVYRINGDDMKLIAKLGSEDATCYDLMAGTQHIIYTMEESNNTLSICVHNTTTFEDGDVELDGDTRPLTSYVVQRRAPLTLHSSIGLAFVGGAAWTSSWTSESNDDSADFTGVNEKSVVALKLQNSVDVRPVVAMWQSVDNSVAMLQTQTHQAQTLLAVGDVRSGILVYDVDKLRQTSTRVTSLHCLYRIDVEHVRYFRFVGACVAVFHRFEPNVSFWNVAEQRTILCINVQDQTRQLSEELDDIDDYVVPSTDDDDDHVTSVTGLPINGGTDSLLVYGTVSGCAFGMSVRRRLTVFSIPCPLPLDQLRSPTSAGAGNPGALRSIAVLPTGQVVLAYVGYGGLTMMDFNVEDPPDRPPTRCQKRVLK